MTPGSPSRSGVTHLTDTFARPSVALHAVSH
jgi:hypothetical protein